jgi:hypothetical protein
MAGKGPAYRPSWHKGPILEYIQAALCRCNEVILLSGRRERERDSAWFRAIHAAGPNSPKGRSLFRCIRIASPHIEV